MSTRFKQAPAAAHFDLVDLRLFANTTAITEFLPPALGAFLAAHPSVTVDLPERLSHEIVRAVIDGVADAGIVAGTVHREGLQALPYHRDRRVLAVPRGHGLAKAPAVDCLDTLADERVGPDASSAIHAFLNGVAAAVGRQLRLRIQVGSFDAMCRVIGTPRRYRPAARSSSVAAPALRAHLHRAARQRLGQTSAEDHRA